MIVRLMDINLNIQISIANLTSSINFIKDILQADEFYSRDEIGFLPKATAISLT